jgi:hypothetical protein
MHFPLLQDGWPTRSAHASRFCRLFPKSGFLDSCFETRSPPDSLAATLAAFPSISEPPFPRFLIENIFLFLCSTQC